MKTKRVKYIDSNIINEQTNEIVKPVIITAVGFVIEETDNYLTIAREIIDNEYRGQVSIPKVAIIIEK